MSRVLRDVRGRELQLAEGCAVEDNVLKIGGEPLVVLDDPQAVPPSLMDAIAASMPGSRMNAQAARPRFVGRRDGSC